MDSTMLYINIEQAIFQNAPSKEFHVKVAMTAKEIKELLEADFDYVLQKGWIGIFPKAKITLRN